MLKPALPPYSYAEWRARPFPERLRMVCTAWTLQGYGSPLAVYALYLVKMGLYVLGWLWCCTATPGLTFANVSSWWASDVAFQKMVLWTMWFEGIGFACGSGPLTGRYLPPSGPLLYFLTPGTTKLPLVRIPGLAGDKRTVLDVILYGATLVLLGRALLAPEITRELIVPILVLVPLMGILDKTLFLVFRSEHHLSSLVCLLSPDWIAGAKVVWLAVWWWAATSKVNRHFPAVMAVMVSNSPFVRSEWVKKQMYRAWPDDLRASRLATNMAHFGTALEYLFPLTLVLSSGGPVTWVTLAVMTVFHLFIVAQVPMGVPLEWNLIMIYGGYVLYGAHADVPLWSITDPTLLAWLVSFHLVLPLYGSVFPARVSFLLAMRYYAGNWAYSVWLFEKEARKKLDKVRKWSKDLPDQLSILYDPDTIELIASKVQAFRAMHLHGRALHELVPLAVDDPGEREWLDGELVAGMVIGWNFGEGHLHDLRLLRALQAQCGFQPGELRVICVESEPLFAGTLDWTIADAASGVLHRGTVRVKDLEERQPWPALT